MPCYASRVLTSVGQQSVEACLLLLNLTSSTVFLAHRLLFNHLSLPVSLAFRVASKPSDVSELDNDDDDDDVFTKRNKRTKNRPRLSGAPLVYELDDDLKVIPQKDAIAPLQGRYLGDQENIKARISGVANQTKIVFVEGG